MSRGGYNPTIRRTFFAAIVAAALILPATAFTTERPAADSLREELSILDALDGYIFDARQAEATRIRTAEYLASAMKRLEKATADLDQATADFNRAQTRLAATLRLARLTEGAGIFESLFVRDRQMESARRGALARRLAAEQANELAEMVKAHDKAIVLEFIAGMERAQTWALNRASEEAIVRLEEETTKRRQLLARLDNDRDMMTRHAAELTRAERDLVTTIESRLSASSGPVDFESMVGKLQLPLVGGKLLVPFGDVVHPRFKTITPHPGWTLGFETRGPRNVRNIAFGRVVWTGRMRGFGTTVVVDHASGWYSVYSGLSLLLTQESAIVREGDIIGQVEAAPGDTGVTMYFELRKDATAVDPVKYISAESIRLEASR